MVAALVVVFGRRLGIPLSARSVTTEGLRVGETADVSALRVKELIILNPDGTAAGSIKASGGCIAFNQIRQDGKVSPEIVFFENGDAIRVYTVAGAVKRVQLEP
jgi:hypothetical protein